jgi:heme oxygenase (mycobilin-producing)
MGWTRVNEFVASEGCEEELTTALTEVTEYLRNQAGCEGAQLLISDEDEARLLVIERWASKEAHHQALVRFPKEKMAAARQWIAKPPHGEFFVEAGTSRRAVH